MIEIDKELIKELNENYENRLTSAQNIRLKEHFLQIRAECINALIEEGQSKWCQSLDNDISIIKDMDGIKVITREDE